jgi:predicted nucleic acid-binding protein
MILFDTTAWVDHFGPAKFTLAPFLLAGRVAMHPFVLGEIALGSLAKRQRVLGELALLPSVRRVPDEDVLILIDAQRLFARGIGWVDAHLLASVLAVPGTWLATFDKRLATIADEFGIGGPAGAISP